MTNLKTILETIGADIEDALPAVLSALGVDNFDEYVNRPPRDTQRVTCSIIYDPDLPFDVYNSTAPVLFYLQLYRKDYEDALLYASAVLDFVKNFDTQKIGFSITDGITIDIIPIERERSTLVYITATFMEPLDSCD